MQLVDIIFLVLFAIFAFKGYSDGLVYSLLSIVILLISMFVSVLYMAELSNYLLSFLFFLGESVVSIISFLILFFASNILLGFLANIVKVLNKMPLLGTINKGFGALFGLFKGMIILSMLIFFLNNYKLTVFLQDELDKSVTYTYLAEIAPAIYDTFISIVPIGQSFYDEMHLDVKESLDNTWQEIQSDSTQVSPAS
jgi:membrane protein required for colicin V production